MPQVIYVNTDGTPRAVDADVGDGPVRADGRVLRTPRPLRYGVSYNRQIKGGLRA